MEFLSSALYALKPRFDDDFVDRYNYYYSTSLFLVFAIFVSAKQWVGQPIECWVPAFFKGAWEEYAEDYCFVQNTYWLSLHDPIPEEYYERDRRQLGYYQWVPFILAGQAVFFYLPYLVWWMFSWQTGVDLHSIVKACKKVAEDDPEDERGQLRIISSYIRETIHSSRLSGSPCPGCFSPNSWGEHGEGYYMTLLSLFVKLLYVINCVLQLFFMNWALRTGSSPYGFWIFWDILQGRAWPESGNFPRVTMCDFEVKVLGNLHRYTVQCVLLINLFNEKIFFILWCWIWAGMFLNLFNFLNWMITYLVEKERLKHLLPYLETGVQYDDQQASKYRDFSAVYYEKYRFITAYLQPDGVLIFHKIKHHVGSTTSAKILRYIFSDYKEKDLDGVFKKVKPFPKSSKRSKSIESGTTVDLRENENNDVDWSQIKIRQKYKNRRL